MNRTMRVHDILLTEANATMMLMLLARNKCHSQLQRLTLRDLHGVCRMCTDTILHSSHKHTHTREHLFVCVYAVKCSRKQNALVVIILGGNGDNYVITVAGFWIC